MLRRWWDRWSEQLKNWMKFRKCFEVRAADRDQDQTEKGDGS